MHGVTFFYLFLYKVVANVISQSSMWQVKGNTFARAPHPFMLHRFTSRVSPPMPAIAAQARKVESTAEENGNLLGRYMTHQKEARSARSKAVKTIAKSAADAALGAVGRVTAAAREAFGGPFMPNPELVPIPIPIRVDDNSITQQLSSGTQYTKSSIHYPHGGFIAFTHISTIPAAMLISFFVGGGIAFAVFCFRRGALTIAEKPFLA